MPIPEFFRKCPPFPSNVPIAEIPIISYGNLKKDTGHDSQDLFEACKDQGFFMLDLRGSEDGERLLKDAEAMFDLSIATFNLGHEALREYKANLPNDLNGYKPAGLLRIGNGKHKDDAIETYTLGRDNILGTSSSRRDPETFQLYREQCREFFRHAHGAVCDILAHLDKHLGLASGTLASLCPLDKPSATSLRMLLTHPQPMPKDHRVNLAGHTDIGSITMLFHTIGGLQILPTGSKNLDSNWRYIRPEPGCALVNIGDSLVEWTGGVLRSSLHRVFTPPGEQAKQKRFSLAYLVRPDHNGSMGRLQSSVIPPLSEDEQAETRSVDEWATWRAEQIINGSLKLAG